MNKEVFEAGMRAYADWQETGESQFIYVPPVVSQPQFKNAYELTESQKQAVKRLKKTRKGRRLIKKYFTRPGFKFSYEPVIGNPDWIVNLLEVKEKNNEI